MTGETVSTEPVRYEERGAVAVVTLNRPRYRNAQNSAMTYALDAAFARAVNSAGVAVIVLAGGAVVGSRGQGGRGRALRPRDGGLPGDVPSLAGDPEAHSRDGPGRLHR